MPPLQYVLVGLALLAALFYLSRRLFSRSRDVCGTRSCDNCPFRTACWNLDLLTDDRAPQTILVEDTAAVTEALRAYADAAEVERAAKKRKAKARKMLDAADAGTYGAFKLSWSGGSPRPAEPDPEGMIRIIEGLGVDLPMRPGGRTSRTISVSRVPEAG